MAGNGMSVGTPVLLETSGSGTDALTYSTGALAAVPVEEFLLLFVSNGHATAGNNLAPTPMTPGLTWTQFITQVNTANGIRGTWFWAKTETALSSGWGVTMAFTIAQSSCQWHVCRVPGVDIGSPILQFGALQSSVLDDPVITLDALGTGNASMGAIVLNATVPVAVGTGQTHLSDSPGHTAPACMSSLEYNLYTGWSEVGWTTTLNYEKVLFAIELKAEPAVVRGPIRLENGNKFHLETDIPLLIDS